MLRVVRNTYPVNEGVAHAESGDIVEWHCLRGAYRLVRRLDGVVVFAGSRVDANGRLYSTGKAPVLIGVVAQVKCRGWVLELELVENDEA